MINPKECPILESLITNFLVFTLLILAGCTDNNSCPPHYDVYDSHITVSWEKADTELHNWRENEDTIKQSYQLSLHGDILCISYSDSFNKFLRVRKKCSDSELDSVGVLFSSIAERASGFGIQDDKWVNRFVVTYDGESKTYVSPNPDNSLRQYMLSISPVKPDFCNGWADNETSLSKDEAPQTYESAPWNTIKLNWLNYSNIIISNDSVISSGRVFGSRNHIRLSFPLAAVERDSINVLLSAIDRSISYYMLDQGFIGSGAYPTSVTVDEDTLFCCEPLFFEGVNPNRYERLTEYLIELGRLKELGLYVE